MKLGRNVAHHPFRVVAAWLLLVVLAMTVSFTGIGGKSLFDTLSSGSPVIPGTQSAAVYEETKEDTATILYLVDEVPSELLLYDSEVSEEILSATDRLEQIDGVAEVQSYPKATQAVVSEFDTQRADALAQMDNSFASAQEEVDALAQVSPEQAAVAQAQLDAEKETAYAQVNEQINTELDTVLTPKPLEDGEQVGGEDSDASDAEAVQAALAPFLSSSENGEVVLVQLEEGQSDEEHATTHEAVISELENTTTSLQGIEPGIVTHTQSMTLAMDAVIDQVQEDLITGESIGLPVALLLMVIVFGGLLAAGLPLIGAVSSIAVGMGVLWVLAQFTSMDSFVINIISIIGLGLSIDYGLLVVSRYREEVQHLLPKAGYLADGSDIPKELRDTEASKLKTLRIQAVQTTVATAGRTVFFSALTIAVSIAALLVMEAHILQMIAWGGIFTVLLAVASAITLIPAIITLFGNKLLRPTVLSKIPGISRTTKSVGDSSSDHGFFSKLAKFVHARPWPILIVVGALLVVMAIPVSDLHLRSSYDEYVPEDSDAGQAIQVLSEDYPAFRTADITILVDSPADEAIGSDFVQELETNYPDATLTLPEAGTEAPSIISLDLDADDPIGIDVENVVKDIRAIDSDVDFAVGGAAALQLDFNDSLAQGLPIALAIIVVAVFVLLFLMTGSLMVPLKAVLLNGLSLVASLGLTVWIFENGYLGFEPVAGLEAYVVAISLAFGFGLAMDYEVFLLARIKEYWDPGYSNDEAVERGLQRSGRIITSAAAIIIAVFIGFVFGELLVVKQVGVALAIIVGVDATIVRMLLVPATMTLLGKWNWWAPKPLVKLHEKFGIQH